MMAIRSGWDNGVTFKRTLASTLELQGAAERNESMTRENSTAAPVPSSREMLIKGAALAVAPTLSTATAAARGRFSLE